MKHEPFIYLWYIAWTKMFYLGVTNGKKEYYTHSAITSDEFRDIVPHSTRSLSERKEFMNNLPKGVHYRKLSKRLIDHFMKEFDIEGDTIYEKMCKLEHKLLVNRKNRHWNRYYNESLGDPKYVDTSGENNPNFKHGNYVGMRSPDKEVRKRAIKKRDAISYANNRDERIAQSREYYANNRDERIAYQKENYAKNKDKILAKRRAKRQREKQQRDKGIGTLPIM